ncbi:tetratricopeptide repeat protein [candidate division GN15 bacterium]|nr:tetratricopeptide repeat protein [candidate division GN15 bacterium]
MTYHRIGDCEFMNTTTTQRPGADRQTEIKDGLALLDLARGWLKQGNTVVAAELLKSALASDEAESQPLVRAGILKETGRTLMMQSDWQGAEPLYLEAQRLYVEHKDLKGAAECARNRANMHFQQGEYQQSVDLCQKALDWASQINNHELRATILNTLAAVQSACGDYHEARKAFKLCLADFQASGNLIRQGYVQLNLGLTNMELEEYDEATHHLNESLSIALSEKDLQLVEICYQNIARCYLEQHETHLAESVLETARKILPGLNSLALETELSLIEGRLLRAMGHLTVAEETLEQTYRKALEHHLTALQADVLLEQGLLQRDLGNYRLAASKLNVASREYRRLGMDRGFQKAIQALEQLPK